MGSRFCKTNPHMNVTSPDITSLDFTALFDISGVPPRVVLTNASTVVNANNLDWWFVVTTPSGTSIHTGTAASPDVPASPFTTETYTAWPQPMGQIEWGNYTVTAYVRDSTDQVFSLSKTANIIRPVGSTLRVRNNFGVASVIADMRCERSQLYVEDTTNLSWDGINPTIISQRFTLIYPLDNTDTQPDPFVLDGAPNGLLPVTFSGAGYQLVRHVTASYDKGDGVIVQIKYKYTQDFDVECDVDLCPLMCEYQKMAEAIEDGSCNSISRDTLVKINALMNIALVAKSQPLCGIKVGPIITQIKALGNFCCDCGPGAGGTGINGAGINGSSAGGEFVFNIEATCGDVEIAEFNQVGNNVVVKIKDKSYAFAAAPAAPGTLIDAFSLDVDLSPDGCLKTVTLNIDQDKLDAWQAANFSSCCPEYVDVVMKGTSNAPAACPNSYFPVELWTPDAGTSLGPVDNVNTLIGKLIGDSSVGGWASKGLWAAAGNCQAMLYRFTSTIGVIPKIPVSVLNNFANDDCVNNERNYTLDANGYCDGLPSQSMNYPYNAYISFTNGGVSHFISNVTSYTNLLAQLNALPAKPAHITFSAAPLGAQNSVSVHDADCSAGTEMLLLVDTVAQVLYGAATNMAQGEVSGAFAIDPKTNAEIGVVCGTFSEQYPWHIAKYGNYLYFVETNTGKLYKIDVSVPMFPVVVATVTLPNTGGTYASFGNTPPYNGNPSTPPHYDVYFPTDINTNNAGFAYIVESSTGSIWKYNLATDVVAGDEQDDALIGRCPRVILGNKMYLSQDGARELDLGLSSGVPRNDLLEIDLTSVGTGSLVVTTLTTIVAVGDEPWAVSWDATRSVLWVTSVNGTLVKFDPVGGGINTYPNLWGLSSPFTGFANTHIFGDRIYCSGLNNGTRYIDLATLAPATVFDQVIQGGVPNDKHYNFIVPQGACYGVVTLNNGTGLGTRGAVAKYTLDGALLGVISHVNAGNMYNVVPLLNVDSTTPNGLC